VSKYALIFRGISGNRGRKDENRLQIESCLYRHIPAEEIGSSSLKKTPLIRERCNRCHRDMSIAEFMIYAKRSVALESLNIIFIPTDFLLPPLSDIDKRQ